jgi:hemoglobin
MMRSGGFSRAGWFGVLVLMLSMPPFVSGAGAQVGQTKRSLYERLGGKEAIAAVVDDFRARVEKDPRIGAKFARSDPERLRVLLIEQICQATGGPCKYTGRTMKQSHVRMGVTSGEFDALVEDLVAALNKFKVGKAEQDELLAALAPMKKDIVEVESPETGTPLPPEFKPAPPMKKK